MGILSRLFGGKKDKDKKGRPAPARERPPPPAKGDTEATGIEAILPGFEQMSAKALARKLGSGNEAVRHAVEERLGELGARSAMRPLINAYLMNGDEPALEALKGFGKSLTVATRDLAADLSNAGERRARIMDILAITGDDAVLPAVREAVEEDDPIVRTRACAALVKLGDLHGISRLDYDLQTNDAQARELALETLMNMDLPEAQKCIDEHVERYVADAGAIPPQVEVRAPRLDDPKLNLHDAVLRDLQAGDHDLTLVLGPEAAKYATGRRGFFEDGLEGVDVHFGTRRMVPEEQIAEFKAARDAAARGQRSVFIGASPTPASDPPLPHLLQPTDDGDFTVKILVVDPHEVAVPQTWWYYMLDKVDLETDFEVILGVSRPGTSAIEDEEYDIWQLLDDDDTKRRFMRALLARL